MNKYELTDDVKHCFNTKVYRIKALRDGKFFNKGELGGYVESEDNLSQVGECWIGDNAIAFNESYISGSAYVYGNAVIQNSKIEDDAQIFDDSEIKDYSVIRDNVTIFGKSIVSFCTMKWNQILKDIKIYRTIDETFECSFNIPENMGNGSIRITDKTVMSVLFSADTILKALKEVPQTSKIYFY